MDVIYPDFSKAFDMVFHNMLINKLSPYPPALNLHQVRVRLVLVGNIPCNCATGLCHFRNSLDKHLDGWFE